MDDAPDRLESPLLLALGVNRDRWIGMDDLTAVAPDYLGLVPEQRAYFKAETRGRWGGLCRM